MLYTISYIDYNEAHLYAHSHATPNPHHDSRTFRLRSLLIRRLGR